MPSRSDLLISIYDKLLETYGHQVCFLNHSNPLELLVATILSAQCTDVRVNKVTPALFKRYSNAKEYAEADRTELEDLIRTTGFFRSKTDSIKSSCKVIAEEHNGKVPASMEALTAMKGIGRKTANVVLGDALGVPGFPVDTHVKRILNLMGIVKSDDPVKIEFRIIKVMPDKYWSEFSHLLIVHGRNRCKARKPDCPNCEIRSLCKYAKKQQ